MLPQYRTPHNILLPLAVWLISALALGACGGFATPEPTPEISVAPIITSNLVVAEGRVAPEKSAVLAFSQSGDIVEIRAKEGDIVKEGDVIIRLKEDKALQANLTLAEQGMLDAQQALDDVLKDEGVDRARAQQSLSDATEQMRNAQRSVYYYLIPSRVAILGMFEAADKLQETVDAARIAFEPYKNPLVDSTGFSIMPATFCVPQSICKGLTIAPADDPFRKYKQDLDEAEGDLNIAITQMRNAAQLLQAKAAVEKAQKDYDEVKSGPDPDKLASAQAHLKTAQLKLDEAKKDLADLTLRAPFDGTVARIDAKSGENISNGKPVVTIADFRNWKVETDNLTEIQVVKIDLDQPVKVAADALPGEKIEGVVDSIRDVYEEKRGDVTYTVTVKLVNPPPQLRWGMTVVTTFDKP
jgi:multidrug efflux pump subunit AcrA (membrane-fusion protein)